MPWKKCIVKFWGQGFQNINNITTQMQTDCCFTFSLTVIREIKMELWFDKIATNHKIDFYWRQFLLAVMCTIRQLFLKLKVHIPVVLETPEANATVLIHILNNKDKTYSNTHLCYKCCICHCWQKREPSWKLFKVTLFEPVGRFFRRQSKCV